MRSFGFLTFPICFLQQWFEDRAHLYGEKTFAGGDRHHGYYKGDKRHGYGVYYWKHGDKVLARIRDTPKYIRVLLIVKLLYCIWLRLTRTYLIQFEGTWVNGELKGKGTYYYGDHSVFKGVWESGRKHGPGIFTVKNKSFKEVWKHGVRVNRVPSDRFYPSRLLRTRKEESEVVIDEEGSGIQIKNEIDRLQKLLESMQAGHSRVERSNDSQAEQEQPSDQSNPESPCCPSSPASHAREEKTQEVDVAGSAGSHNGNGEEEVGKDVCKICYDAKINCVLIRCGHMCTCLNCSEQLEKCPICRKYIDDVIQTFRS